MNCDVGEATEGLENELWVGEVTKRLENDLCYNYNHELSSFSNPSVALPKSQLILQPFCSFTYVTVHSPALLLLLLHLIHLASCSWLEHLSVPTRVLSLSLIVTRRTIWGFLDFSLGSPFLQFHPININKTFCTVFGDLSVWWGH